ncbi:hypothetical protein ABK905_09570 [Acerihabitans sp. KWT182]|uniref:Uncharacterized protein n=1 Tax=Acerihabitans sp. KWT182 TaxID=3157919 RepID=A0AAU7QFS5_9GAMM
MENSKPDDTTLLVIIGLLVSVLITVSVLFGIAYFYDLRHGNRIDSASCYSRTGGS